MNKFTLLSVVFILNIFLVVPASSQLNIWGSASPFSDSLTDNIDATLNAITYFAGQDHYVFWVRSADSASSDIVTKRYYSEDEPMLVLSDGQHHYRNPQVIPVENWQIPDSLFALFYESDLDGDFDIYYCFYTPGGFTPSQPLTLNDQEDSGMEANDAGGIVWENNGAIWFADLSGTYYGNILEIDTMMLVDSNLCSHPSLSHNFIYNGLTEFLAWEKVIDDTSRILIKRKDLNSPNWFDNEILFNFGNNTRPSFSESTESSIPSTLTWNTTVDNSFAIYASDLEDMYFLSDFRQTAPFNPHCYNVIMLVDWLWDYSIVTFESEEQSDIYGGSWGWSSILSEYTNISNSAATDRNPYLFEGMSYGHYEDVINIWESYRNGHWQLYSAVIPVEIFGGINEPGKSSDFRLSASPNPLSQETKLSFKLATGSSCRISLMSVLGKTVQRQELGYLLPGQHEVPFNLSRSCSPGIYFVLLEAGGIRQGIKVIIN